MSQCGVEHCAVCLRAEHDRYWPAYLGAVHACGITVGPYMCFFLPQGPHFASAAFFKGMGVYTSALIFLFELNFPLGTNLLVTLSFFSFFV